MLRHKMADDAPEAPAPSRRDFLDRVWDFFASVPVATALLFIIALVAIAGTLVEQEGTYGSPSPPAQYYPMRYGPVWGPLLLVIGLTHAYSTWWFITLLGLMGASLLICSLNRFVPVWKATQRPNTSPAIGFIRTRQERFAAPGQDTELGVTADALRALRYRVQVKGNRLFAERGRWNRWGPYITHVGVLLVLLGGLTRAVPGWYSETSLWVSDGETVPVPGADFLLKSEGFELDFYPDGRPKTYATHAVVIDQGQEKLRHTIKVNYPLMYGGVSVYQTSYDVRPGLATVQLINRADGMELGRFQFDLSQPQATYQASDMTVRVLDYFPDFSLDADNQPVSRSSAPNNPGVRLQLVAADGTEQPPTWYFINFPEMEFDQTSPYKWNTVDITARNRTGLRVKRDVGVPLLYLGLLVMTLGIGLTFYLSHRRIWAALDGGQLIVGGQTNRYAPTLARDFRRLQQSLGLMAPDSPADQEG